MRKVFSKEEVVKTFREAVVSDFSQSEIPKLHWSAVTRFEAATSDGCGNKHRKWNLDLLPEEMADFCSELDSLIRSLTEKFTARKAVRSDL